MHYVYSLRSIKFSNQYYTGFTADLESRIEKHNKGDVPHTSKFIPWELDAYVSFKTAELAQSFELYLKTGSGREFARRHFR